MVLEVTKSAEVVLVNDLVFSRSKVEACVDAGHPFIDAILDLRCVKLMHKLSRGNYAYLRRQR